ncbi:MAG: hypothetical protein M1817_004555 [Caeruleum heppii]|nr:MAG: hypothetical protein M1817_004555 [Caeruleum heppii]
MPEQAAQQQQEAGLSPSIKAAIRGILIFFAGQMIIKQFTGGNKSSKTGSGRGSAVIPAYEARPLSMSPEATYNPIPQVIAPIWPLDTSLDIQIYVSSSFVVPKLDQAPKESKVVDERGLRIGDYKDTREIHTSFQVPQEVQKNGTLWGHFFIGISGNELDLASKNYDPSKAYHFSRPLNQYLAKKKVAKTKKLLGKSNATEETDEPTPGKARIISSYYHPNFTMSIIPDSGTLIYPTLHPAVRQFLYPEATGARDETGQNGWYYPILFINTFWQLRDHMTELNSTVDRLPLHITLNNQKNWQFSMLSSIDEGMKQNQRQVASGGPIPAAGDGSEFEEVKRIFLDTNVYLLATTGVVSMLHMVFEMLAFKSDISHWKNKKDNVGVSFRTILANVFMQTIIFLYLIDNSDGTSYMILLGQGFGILLEAWKITKTVDVRVRPAPPESPGAPFWASILPYRVTFEDKHTLSDTEQKTQEYDQIAFKYLYIVAVPLLLAYAIYSVLYDTHKSWYSFVITTLVGSVYAYGFLMMVPSLYINYRLKKTIHSPSHPQSVAHMPAKAMTYKFLNTFIDDLFAFTIKMPTLHRLATLRDDVIFFIYLYQSRAYRVDYSRINEFGQGPDEGDEKTVVEGSGMPDSKGADAQREAKGKVVELVEKEKEKEREGVKVGGKGKGEGEGGVKRRRER